MLGCPKYLLWAAIETLSSGRKLQGSGDIPQEHDGRLYDSHCPAEMLAASFAVTATVTDPEIHRWAVELGGSASAHGQIDDRLTPLSALRSRPCGSAYSCRPRISRCSAPAHSCPSCCPLSHGKSTVAP